jgi:F0F1-type ATP synthase gamma subunit
MAILESFTSEHAARTISMKTATDNAKELYFRAGSFKEQA